MNASTLLNDDMTLEEKLAAIDEAMQAQASRVSATDDASTVSDVPEDPALQFMCEGCQ